MIQIPLWIICRTCKRGRCKVYRHRDIDITFYCRSCRIWHVSNR